VQEVQEDSHGLILFELVKNALRLTT